MNIFEIDRRFSIGDRAITSNVDDTLVGTIVNIDHDVESKITWFKLRTDDGRCSSGYISHWDDSDSTILM